MKKHPLYLADAHRCCNRRHRRILEGLLCSFQQNQQSLVARMHIFLCTVCISFRCTPYTKICITINPLVFKMPQGSHCCFIPEEAFSACVWEREVPLLRWHWRTVMQVEWWLNRYQQDSWCFHLGKYTQGQKNSLDLYLVGAAILTIGFWLFQPGLDSPG